MIIIVIVITNYNNKYYFYHYFSKRLRYKGGLSRQGKKLHKSSFVTVNIFEQLRCLLESKYNEIIQLISFIVNSFPHTKRVY